MSARHEAPWTVRIRDASGKIHGAGFLVEPDLVCTCAHVVQDVLGLEETDGRVPRLPVPVELMITGERRVGRVVAWVPGKEAVERVSVEELAHNGIQDLRVPAEMDGDDIAVLRLEEGYEGADVVRLASPRSVYGHTYRTFGFPEGYDTGQSSQGEFRSADSLGRVQMNTGAQEEPITGGYSGAAVWDAEAGAVVGMVAESDQRLIARMIPAHHLADRLRWIHPGYEDAEAQVGPLVFAGERHTGKRSLANAIRLNWFAAKRQFFGTPNVLMSETEGWRLLVEWLRQYDKPDSEAGEEVRELIDGRLRSGIPADFMVFFLLAWLDPDHDPVWRGRRVTYEYLCEMVLPPLPEDIVSVEQFLRGGLANFERLTIWRQLDTSIFWEALSRFNGFEGARRHYQNWMRARKDWDRWWDTSVPARGVQIFSSFGRRALAHAVLLNAVLPAPEAADVRTLRMTRYAHPGSEPGGVPWYDEFMQAHQERSPIWWVGVTLLSRYAWEHELTARPNDLKAFARAGVWTGMHAGVLLLGCLVGGGLLALASGGGSVFGAALFTAFAVDITALIVLGRAAFGAGGRYRPPFNDRVRLIASFRDRRGRTVAKVGAGAVIVLMFQVPVLGVAVAVGLTIWLARTAATWQQYFVEVHKARHARYCAELAERFVGRRNVASV
ncbi:serine protease [Promicromonospora sp. MEB111]|uniref:S1 family peptidase n=1 Tax=unclassified Promicromonospora TaxID=2647929 RepID=UPI002550D684|nr:serine protease [Promicromonospora sp. MEB111]